MPKTKKRASKRATKKTTKKSTKKAAAVAQPCLSQAEASFIVGGCLPSGTHDNDDTLEETGLISPPLRDIFRECVFNGVRAAGCDINRGQIPNSANTTVGQVIEAVFRNSR